MRIKDMRLRLHIWNNYSTVRIYDQDGNAVFRIGWGVGTGRTKRQAIAIAKRLRDRFNSGQQK